MKCLFCKKEMVDFHICNSTVQNMSLRPDGMEPFGYVTFGEIPPNTACTGLAETSAQLSGLAQPANQ